MSPLAQLAVLGILLANFSNAFSPADWWSPALPPALVVAAREPGGLAADQRPTDHVRAMSARAAALLEQGSSGSATFKALVDTLERSDVIVLVETGVLQDRGRIVFLGASPAGRFLRITLDLTEVDERLLPLLAHELQHAVEVASAPGVSSGATMTAYYRQHGYLVATDHLCTREAQRVTAVVRAELEASRRGERSHAATAERRHVRAGPAGVGPGGQRRDGLRRLRSIHRRR